MKFFIFSATFWGSFLILIGVALLAKHVFNLDFPVGRFIWAIFLILLGVQFLVGFTFKQEKGTAMFSESVLVYEEGRSEYNCIFGKAYLDLSKVQFTQDTRIKASSVFGEMVVRLPDSVNVIVKGSSAFGNVVMPDGSNASFGEINWKPTIGAPDGPRLMLKAESVFGQCRVEQ
jgi:predicted membrane protein